MSSTRCAKGDSPIFADTKIGTVPKKPVDDPWDAFEVDDDGAEPEPEPGDFWGELDHDCDHRSE